MKQNYYFWISGLIFALVGTIHLFRLVWGWEVYIADFSIPAWVSVMGMVVGYVLAYTAYRLRK